MYKKLFIAMLAIIGVIAATAGLSALTRSTEPEESSSEAEPALSSIVVVPSAFPERISIQVPPGFTETSSDFYDLYYIRDDASLIVTGEYAVIAPQIEDYIVKVKEQYAAAADEYQLVEESPLYVNGLIGHTMEFTYAIVGKDVRQEMACVNGIFIKDDYIYIVTCKSRLETFSAYRSAFKQAIASVQIADAPSLSEVAGQQGSNAAVSTTQTTAATAALTETASATASMMPIPE